MGSNVPAKAIELRHAPQPVAPVRQRQRAEAERARIEAQRKLPLERLRVLASDLVLYGDVRPERPRVSLLNNAMEVFGHFLVQGDECGTFDRQCCATAQIHQPGDMRRGWFARRELLLSYRHLRSRRVRSHESLRVVPVHLQLQWCRVRRRSFG